MRGLARVAAFVAKEGGAVRCVEVYVRRVPAGGAVRFGDVVQHGQRDAVVLRGVPATKSRNVHGARVKVLAPRDPLCVYPKGL